MKKTYKQLFYFIVLILPLCISANDIQYTPLKASYVLDPTDADGEWPNASINRYGDVMTVSGTGIAGDTEKVRIFSDFVQNGLTNKQAWNDVEPGLAKGWHTTSAASANAIIVIRFGQYNSVVNVEYNDGTNYSGDVVIYRRKANGSYEIKGDLPAMMGGIYNLTLAAISPESKFIAINWEASNGSNVLHIYKKNDPYNARTDSGYHLIQEGFRSNGTRLVALTFDNVIGNTLGIMETYVENPDGGQSDNDLTRMNIFTFRDSIGTFQLADSHEEAKAFQIRNFRISNGMIALQVATTVYDAENALFAYNPTTQSINKMLPPFLNLDNIHVIEGYRARRAVDLDIMFGELVLMRLYFVENTGTGRQVILFNNGTSENGWKLENFLEIDQTGYLLYSTSTSGGYILNRGRFAAEDKLFFYSFNGLGN